MLKRISTTKVLGQTQQVLGIQVATEKALRKINKRHPKTG